MKDGLTLPVVVTEADGTVVKAALTNEKGFRKSLENKALWVIHPETGRLLPDETITEITTIVDRNGWYVAQTRLSTQTAVQEETSPEEAPKKSATTAEMDLTILPELEALIAQRHKEMPEGSYTTHLFEKGEEKIRKKMGEEAVELLLALKHDDIVYESADLIYHMLVFFEDRGISIAETLAELRKRH